MTAFGNIINCNFYSLKNIQLYSVLDVNFHAAKVLHDCDESGTVIAADVKCHFLSSLLTAVVSNAIFIFVALFRRHRWRQYVRHSLGDLYVQTLITAHIILALFPVRLIIACSSMSSTRHSSPIQQNIQQNGLPPKLSVTFRFIIKCRGGQPFEARVQQKEKSKLRGPHLGNTFITIKNTIYNTKSINVKSVNIDCYYVSFNTPT